MITRYQKAQFGDTAQLTLNKNSECLIIFEPRGSYSATWWAAALAMSAILLSTVIGNGAVMAALRRARRAPAHYPLASLATADLLVGACVLPIATARELFVFHLDWIVCACWSTLDVLCCTASILSLCCLGWERWCAISDPFARAKRSSRAKILALLIWPVSTLVALPTAFIPSPVHFHEGEMPKACTVNTNVGYVFFSVSLSFYIPASVMLVMYARILRSLASPPPIRAHRGRSPIPTQQTTLQENDSHDIELPEIRSPKNRIGAIQKKVTAFLSPNGRHLNLPGEATSPSNNTKPVPGSPGCAMIHRQRRATRTIISLMSVFLFCWTPFFIMLPFDSICDCVRDSTWLWCAWLGYANSAIDPLVYAAASPSVRRALHMSLTASTSSRTSASIKCLGRN